MALIGGGIFVVVSYVTQLVHPGGRVRGLGLRGQLDRPADRRAAVRGVFLAGLVVAQLASGLAAGQRSRLLYAVGGGERLGGVSLRGPAPAGHQLNPVSRRSARSSGPTCSPSWTATPFRWACLGGCWAL
ncbi:hypothetical protein M1D88_04910 [Arthrobacter sp. R1-13]